MPGSLSAAVRWTDRPTRLQFRVDGQDMSILQDGELLASTPLDEALARRLTVRVRAEDVTWGRGIFGDFGGASVRGQLE
jgi:hypothetical protein